MKLTLRTKLIGAFVIMLLLTSIVGFVGVFSSRIIENHMENIIEEDVQPASILGVVARRVGFIHSNSLLHLITTSIDDMNRYESEIADWAGRINTNLDSLANMFQDQAALNKLAEFRADWDTYLRIWNEQVVPLSRANLDEEAFALARKGGAAGMVAHEAMYKLDELHDTIIATSDQSLILSKRHFTKIQIILLVIILFAIILGLVFGIKQSSRIAGAVNTVSKAAQLVASGDLDQRAEVETGDEIESMADSFNTMTCNLKIMVEELRHEITERKRAEEGLRENERWLSTTLRSIGDAVIATDAHGFVTLMNSVAGSLTGWDEAEAVGRPLEDVFNIINEQTGQPVENPAARVLREGFIVGLANHTILIARDGTERPVADSGAPIRNEEGNVIGTVMVFRDITESKLAEEQIQQQKDFLDSVLKSLTHPFYVIDVNDYTIKLANSAAMLGNLSETATCYALTHNSDKPCESAEHPCPLEEVKKTKKPVTVEHIHYDKNGNARNVEVHGFPILDSEGNVVWIIEYSFDITERKQAEKALQESEEKLSSFMNSAPDAFILFNSELNLIQFNATTAELLSFSAQDIGKSILDVLPDLKETGGYDKYLEVLKTGKSFSIVDLVPHPKFGDLHLTARAFKVGESLGLIITDITELKQVEEKLIRNEKLAVLGQLSGGVGHELRNPLGVISNAVYFLQMTLSDADETTREYLEIISSEIRNSEKIVSDLLDLSRIKPAARERTAVSELFDQVLEKQPPPEKVTVNTEIPSELPPVFVDPRQIGQVLLNLVTNAYQAMPEGGILTIGAETEKEKVSLFLTDTGCGISEKAILKIFEPLFTTRARGIGLGLAVSRNLVEVNGGILEVRSEEGKGSTFTVILPIKEALS
ncbi:MAG: PAS domain S-box protein [Candidatus Aegiribacteria sp.]|nr:PAS domain S-box protein [Candidatus Aegiribacteria sp.]